MESGTFIYWRDFQEDSLTHSYVVLPYTGLAHLTVQNSSNLVNAAHWAEHDLQVTKRKDTEPKSAHRFNSQDVYDPPVNFDDFFNGESLEQEDLVVWFNLGMHHGEYHCLSCAILNHSKTVS